MIEVLILLWSALIGLFRSRARLEAEILILRHKINVLRRNSPKRFAFRTFDNRHIALTDVTIQLLRHKIYRERVRLRQASQSIASGSLSTISISPGEIRSVK